MSHFKKGITSPALVMGTAYSYVIIISIILYSLGMYSNNNFFTWGVPVKFFNVEITEISSFYYLHILIFGHQLVNNWVNSVVYPWIINSVQDPKNKLLEYSRFKTLLLINLFDIYSEIDMIMILMGFTSQISFVITIITANLISGTIINYKYIVDKEISETTPLMSIHIQE